MNIRSQHPLESHNSFGFSVKAEYFVAVETEAELIQALEEASAKGWPVFVLGGGSNLVLTRDIEGLVIHWVNTDTEYRDLGNGDTEVIASAGKLWHELVLDTLQEGLCGLENLSLIPGLTGAAPVQNIGAYGVELKDRLRCVRGFHRPSGEWQTLTPSDCEFDYRDSIFKRNPGDYVITQVHFTLSSKLEPVTHYAALDRALQTAEIPSDPVARARLISDTVIGIRQSKLPDPTVIGNAGSFFKNPVVTQDQAASLLTTHPNMVQYP